MICCGQKMEALVPNTAEAWIKHLLYVHKAYGSVYVRIGETTHSI